MDCILTYKGKDFTEKEFKKEYIGRIHTEVFKEGKVKEDFIFDNDKALVISRNRQGTIKQERLMRSELFDHLNTLTSSKEAKDIYTTLKTIEERDADIFIERKIKELKTTKELEIDCSGKGRAGRVSGSIPREIVQPTSSNKPFSIKK